jgi:hypothetical protein
VLWFVSSCVTICQLVFFLASSVLRVCVGVRVPWFVCISCFLGFLWAVKCAVAGSLIATGVWLASRVYVCIHSGKWLCG